MELTPGQRDRLRTLRHLVLDLDGTLYRGNTLFDSTRPLLELLARLGIGRTFLTNNSSKSKQQYVSHMRALQIDCEASDVYTSADATIEYIARHQRDWRRLYVLGTESLRAEFADAGFLLCGTEPDDAPDAVVVGFDTSLTYDRLCRTAYWIDRGRPYVATHPDRICPTDQPTVLVDCGSICAALEHATGRPPVALLGKPNPMVLEGLIRRHHLAINELAVVGDRLYTDMALAEAAGCLGILVLTGETTAEDAARGTVRPGLVVDDLAVLATLLAERGDPQIPSKNS
jgi:NagD protein